jgi:hypothetical protein
MVLFWGMLKLLSSGKINILYTGGCNENPETFSLYHANCYHYDGFVE